MITKWKVFWAGLTGFLTPGTSAFEKISQLAIDAVNEALSGPSVASKVLAVRAVAAKALDLLDRYSGWCPAKWREEFDALRSAVREVVAAFADGKVDKDELKAIVDEFKAAYASWTGD